MRHLTHESDDVYRKNRMIFKVDASNRRSCYNRKEAQRWGSSGVIAKQMRNPVCRSNAIGLHYRFMFRVNLTKSIPEESAHEDTRTDKVFTPHLLAIRHQYQHGTTAGQIGN